VAETLALEPFADKWRSFGWGVVEVDGHDHDQIKDALKKQPGISGKPNVVIAHTIKGKGVSFMENTVLWHYRCARGEEFDMALKELEES
jgi:transketolase